MSKKILVVEDDPTLRVGLVDALKAESYDVTFAFDGLRAAELLVPGAFDLAILDVMLPGRGGLEVLRDMRARRCTTPVIMLTARSDENDRVLGLELGADDYVTKPFSLRELLARVRAHLRRQAAHEEVPTTPQVSNFKIGDADVDLAAFQIRRAGRTLPITPREAAMLGVLWTNRGRVVTRQEMLEVAWQGALTVGNRTIDTHVLNLRQKVEPDPRSPKHIVTVHGAGYRLIE